MKPVGVGRVNLSAIHFDFAIRLRLMLISQIICLPDPVEYFAAILFRDWHDMCLLDLSWSHDGRRRYSCR